MEDLKTLKSEIQSSTGRLNKLHEEYGTKKYKNEDDSTWCIVRTLFWCLLAAGNFFLAYTFFLAGEEGLPLAIVFGVLTVAALVLYVIAFVKYVRRRATFIASPIVILICSAPVIFAGYIAGKLIFVGNAGDTMYHRILEILNTDSLDVKESDFRTYVLILCAALAVLFGVILIGVIRGLVKECKEYKRVKIEQGKVARKIQVEEAVLKGLESRYSASEKEAGRLFDRETEKKEPDWAVISGLADIGYERAEKYRNDKIREEQKKQEKADKEQGKKIFEEEIRKEVPDPLRIIQASMYGDPDASLYVAKATVLAVLEDISAKSSGQRMSDEDRYRSLGMAQDYLEKARSCADKDMRTVLLAFVHILRKDYEERNKESVDLTDVWENSRENSRLMQLGLEINEAITAAGELKKIGLESNSDSVLIDVAEGLFKKYKDYLSELSSNTRTVKVPADCPRFDYILDSKTYKCGHLKDDGTCEVDGLLCLYYLYED